MKKYMIAALAAIVMAGAVNAQVAKQPGKNANASHLTNTSKPATTHNQASTTTLASKSKTAKNSTKTDEMGIKRKHHKKTKSPKKTSAK